MIETWAIIVVTGVTVILSSIPLFGTALGYVLIGNLKYEGSRRVEMTKKADVVVKAAVLNMATLIVWGCVIAIIWGK